MYIGIDLGTSGVKVILLSEAGQVLATETKAIPISRPKPLWSEQAPQDWWQATDDAMKALGNVHDLSQVKAIGLSGQMHGATLLDSDNKVIRPAILWNDGRCAAECLEIESTVTVSRSITGNLMMAGFTAPKLLWVKNHEPENFAKVQKVLLPKDYLRLLMTGDFATDLSDASGTGWIDVAKRDWNSELLAACGLTLAQMPTLYEGNQITGHLTAEIATRWHMPAVPVVAGGGDNAAGAIGVGVYQAGQAMLSLGTSGVYFAANDGFLMNTENAVHSFCHALPQSWHLMSVILSAAACLDWVAKLTRFDDVPTMLIAVESAANQSQDAETVSPLYFLPYLSGERTPHNDPLAKGVFWGLTHEHDAVHLALAVLEGVGFALADGMDAVHATGINPETVTLIGGGARSTFWRQMLADISGKTLEYRTGGDVGPALGAARLAQMAVNIDLPIKDLLPELPLEQTHHPVQQKHSDYLEKRKTFRELYQRLRGLV